MKKMSFKGAIAEAIAPLHFLPVQFNNPLLLERNMHLPEVCPRINTFSQ